MKRNLIATSSEEWRPPLMSRSNTSWTRFLLFIRRWVDLQFGSGWNDLAEPLRQAQGNLLDVGCGAQPYRTLLSTTVRYMGIDIAEAHEKFGYKLPDTVYYSGSAWPVQSSSMDTVLCTETLEHVLDTSLFLGEAFRCLKSNGQLMATVPFAARWHFIPHDYWRFTPSSLNVLLEKAGFKNVRVYGRGNALTVACYKNNALILRLIAPRKGILVIRFFCFCVGILCLPLFILFTLIAQISLLLDAGDDCLGYTFFADKP